MKKVKDPPHLGFSCSDIKSSDKQTSRLLLVIKRLENTLNIYTSTPNLKRKLELIMDISFSKHYQTLIPQIDNDSGYMSQNQESNSESLFEGSTENEQMILSDVKSIYLSDDALLEKPEVKSQQQHLLQDMNDSTEEIQPSVSTVSEHFSVLRDSCESTLSDESATSVIISKIDPIIITENGLNTKESCDMNNESTTEDNINISTISNDSKATSSNCNYYNTSTDFDSDKENVSLSERNDISSKSSEQMNCSYSISNNISSPMSPELFSDEETVRDSRHIETNRSFTREEKYVLKQDHKLKRNVQRALSGVLPPPSLTTIQLSTEEILERFEQNKQLFWPVGVIQEVDSTIPVEVDKPTSGKESLLLTSKNQECLKKPWPEIMEERYHGLHHNRSKLSEEFEMLCMKYAERYVSCETQSTCTVFQQTFMSSPLKRKANRLRWAVKSPGRRLSHLARRRITFSSANLQAAGSNSGLGAHTRQIVMDSKRFQLLSRRQSPVKRSPRKIPRKSPRKSPRKKIRTPSSSAKKRLTQELQFISHQSALIASASRASATKRALFQSPDKSLTSTLSKPLLPSTSGTSSVSPFKKRMTPKCALFTSPSKSSISRIDNKRKRADSDDLHPSKLFRSVSLQEAGSGNPAVKREILKVKSEINLSTSQYIGELSAHHKKKLQWAVYEALRTQNVGINHPQFKQFASVLARVTRRFLPNLAANAPRPEGGTSERMLRIARQHINAVINGKSVDEIIKEFEISRIKNMKPNGYVGLEAHQNDISTARNKENVFRDRLNTMSTEKQKVGINRGELIKTILPRFENPIERARRVIKFDDENKDDVR